MFPLWILLLCHTTDAIIWHSSLGSEVSRCVGDNVTFDWTYVTERDESVFTLFWVSMERGTIATYFREKFSPYLSRLEFAPPSGLTLNDLRAEDNGNYTITALGGYKAGTVQLIVSDAPQTVKGHLEVFQTSSKFSTDDNTQLKCGHFISRGTPPVSVVWKDPDGDEIQSSDFNNGFFVLNLPAQFKEGNYSCRLDRNSSATQCLPSDSPLLHDAVIIVHNSLAHIDNEMIDIKDQMMELRAELASFTKDDVIEIIRSQIAEVHNQTGQVVGSVHREIALLKEIVHDMNETILRQDIIIKQQEAMIQSLAQNFTEFQTGFQHHYNKTTNLHETLTDLQSRQTKASQDLEERISELENSQMQLRTASSNLQDQVDGLVVKNSQVDAGYAGITAAVSELQKSHNDSVTSSELRLREELTKFGRKQQESRQELSSEMQDLRKNFSVFRSSMDVETLSLRRDLQSQKSEVNVIWEDARRNFTTFDSNLEEFRRVKDRELQSLRSDLQAFGLRYSNLTTRIEQRAQENREEIWGKLQDDSSKLLDLEARLDGLQTQQDEMNRNVTNDFNNLTDRQIELSGRLESGEKKCLLMEVRLQAQLSLLNATLERQIGVGLKDQGQANNATLWQLGHDVSVLQRQQLADKTALTNLTTSNQKQINSLQNLLDATAGEMFRNLTKGTSQQVAEVRSSLDSRLNALTTRLDAGDRRHSELDGKVRYVETALKKFNPVRLQGGSTNREGRVEILMGNTWSTVCDDGWDDVDAGVVCVSLGFSRLGARATTQASFGQGSGSIALDDVACIGSELDLRFCSAPPLNTHNCGHSEDAGVICQP